MDYCSKVLRLQRNMRELERVHRELSQTYVVSRTSMNMHGLLYILKQKIFKLHLHRIIP